MNDVFSGLEHLGFSLDKKINLYRNEQKPKISPTLEDKKTNHIFLKEIECPVCSNKFKTPSVKVNSPRIAGKDSDFFIRYSVINPYLYDVYICNSCGYSAMKGDFSKIRQFQIDLVLKEIKPKWKGRTYPSIFTEEVAIERYKLALLTAVLCQGKSSTKAMICLKIAWMYRLLNDSKNENLFISNAIEGFTYSYSNEAFPVYGLNIHSVAYLLGELHRRLGNNIEALNWISKVIIATGINPRLKEMARDCKDLIKEQ